MKQTNTLTRREFLKASVGVAVGGALASLPIELFAHAHGSDKLRVGLMGAAQAQPSTSSTRTPAWNSTRWATSSKTDWKVR